MTQSKPFNAVLQQSNLYKLVNVFISQSSSSLRICDSIYNYTYNARNFSGLEGISQYANSSMEEDIEYLLNIKNGPVLVKDRFGLTYRKDASIAIPENIFIQHNGSLKVFTHGDLDEKVLKEILTTVRSIFSVNRWNPIYISHLNPLPPDARNTGNISLVSRIKKMDLNKQA